MPAKKISVSMPEELYAAAEMRRKAFGYAKLSHYIQACVQADVASRSTTHVRSMETPTDYALNERSYQPTPGPVSTPKKKR